MRMQNRWLIGIMVAVLGVLFLGVVNLRREWKTIARARTADELLRDYHRTAAARLAGNVPDSNRSRGARGLEIQAAVRSSGARVDRSATLNSGGARQATRASFARKSRDLEAEVLPRSLEPLDSQPVRGATSLDSFADDEEFFADLSESADFLKKYADLPPLADIAADAERPLPMVEKHPALLAESESLPQAPRFPLPPSGLLAAEVEIAVPHRLAAVSLDAVQAAGPFRRAPRSLASKSLDHRRQEQLGLRGTIWKVPESLRIRLQRLARRPECAAWATRALKHVVGLDSASQSVRAASLQGLRVELSDVGSVPQEIEHGPAAIHLRLTKHALLRWLEVQQDLRTCVARSPDGVRFATWNREKLGDALAALDRRVQDDPQGEHWKQFLLTHPLDSVLRGREDRRRRQGPAVAQLILQRMRDSRLSVEQAQFIASEPVFAYARELKQWADGSLDLARL
ncbi:MAG: hypothetical protein N2C14_04040, partial [Planctomycetales bacterium]